MSGPCARIVLTTFGSFGDLNPYIGLALGLRARGHLPVLATSEFYREHVEREGLAFHPVRPDIDPNDAALLARILHPARGPRLLLRELLLPYVHEAWEDLSEAARGADLIVTHPLTFAGPIVAQEHGLHWISTVLSPASFLSVHDLPVFPPFPAAKRIERVPGLARLALAAARRLSSRWLAPVRRLRAERGLPPAGHPLFEGQHSPEAVLALFSRVLAAPQPDWPPSAHITGPIFYNGPAAAASAELEAFLDAGPPPVVFTLGSSAVSAAGSFYEVSAEAARRLGVRAVLLVGRHAANRPRRRLSADVRIVDYAPHGELFPRAAATVHQGGIGTLTQALRAGRPMLVVPHAYDQPDNAERARRLGVARIVYPRRYTVPRVVQELRALLDGRRYAECAASVAGEVRTEDGVAAACRVIEARLRTGGAAGSPRRESSLV